MLIILPGKILKSSLIEKKYLNSFVFHEMTAVLVVALDVYIG